MSPPSAASLAMRAQNERIRMTAKEQERAAARAQRAFDERCASLVAIGVDPGLIDRIFTYQGRTVSLFSADRPPPFHRPRSPRPSPFHCRFDFDNGHVFLIDQQTHEIITVHKSALRGQD